MQAGELLFINIMTNHEPTTTDILEAINDFSSDNDKRFNKMDDRFEKVENDLKVIKSTMVTKGYLDEKLSDLRGDLSVLIRKEDTKVKELVNILVKKKILSEKEQERLFKMEPFAQISL